MPVYELHHGNQIKRGHLEYLRELSKGLEGEWFICFHALSSMRMDPRAIRINIDQMNGIFKEYKKGKTTGTIAKEFHLAPDYIQKIINAKL